MKIDIKKQFFTTLSDINISNIIFFCINKEKKVQETIQDPLKKQEPFKENQEPFKRSPKPFNKRFQEPFKENQEPLKKIPQNLLIKDFKELFSRHYFVTNTILFVFRLPF